MRWGQTDTHREHWDRIGTPEGHGGSTRGGPSSSLGVPVPVGGDPRGAEGVPVPPLLREGGPGASGTVLGGPGGRSTERGYQKPPGGSRCCYRGVSRGLHCSLGGSLGTHPGTIGGTKYCLGESSTGDGGGGVSEPPVPVLGVPVPVLMALPVLPVQIQARGKLGISADQGWLSSSFRCSIALLAQATKITRLPLSPPLSLLHSATSVSHLKQHFLFCHFLSCSLCHLNLSGLPISRIFQGYP